MNIGDLLLKLVADGSELTPSVVKEAGKAGDAGAQTLGQKLGSGLKTNGVRAFGVAASGAFAIATKGALELEDVQARFQAETGASAAEASHAADVINKVAGENRLSLEEVADAAAKVHNDLGLTGDAADAATASFAKYARVTGQQAGPAVSAFDDILDSWGLTAADATGIMDKLVASHQKYGGSIDANQAALAQMAPQLKALNVDTDGAIGLLNLFAASGIDASKATGALNAAVKKLKPGQSLDDLIKQVSAIEDPTLRAQKAIEIFGAKGGVALANALHPGINGLKDFEVSAEDATGATDKAADAIDSTFGNRIKKAISEATASLRGFGKSFGPLLTSAGALGSLAATIFPNFGPALGKSLTRGFKLPFAGLKAIGVRLMSAIGVGVASKAGEEAVGTAIGDAVEGGIKGAATKSGVMAAAQGMGLAVASAIGVGLAAGIAVLSVAKMISDQEDKEKADLAANISKEIETATVAQLKNTAAAIQKQLDSQKLFGVIPITFGGEDSGPNGLSAQLQRIKDQIANENIPRAVGEHFAAGHVEVEAGVKTMMHGASHAMDASKPGITKAAKKALSGVAGTISQTAAIAKALGAKIPESVAAGVLAHQNEAVDAMSTLKDLMANELTPTKDIARNIGILTSKELAAGLHDGRTAVREEARRVQAIAEARLAELIKNGGHAGKAAMSELVKKMHDKNPAVRAEAQRVYSIVKGKLDNVKKPAGTAGANAGTAFISNLKRTIGAGGTITVKVRTSDSTKGGKALGGPVKAGDPWWVGERGPEIFVPDVNGHVLTHAESVKATASGHGIGSGGDTINVNMPVTGVLRAETPADLARPLRMLAATGAISNPRRRRRVEVPTRA